jgi:hypothetical protein
MDLWCHRRPWGGWLRAEEGGSTAPFQWAIFELWRVLFKMKSRQNPSPKRCIRAKDPSDAAYVERLKVMAETVIYGGNPEHKRNPGDFGLDPPSLPRQGKTLCDGANIFSRAEALSLLRQGIRRGLVSEQVRGGWPQNIWAVTASGIALEAMLENRVTGAYHGYPLLDDDPLTALVFERWSQE